MARLVTGVFYTRGEAERAVGSLKEQGIPAADVYLEVEVSPTVAAPAAATRTRRSEHERRYAGLETGLIVGLALGLMAGMGMGMFGSAMLDLVRSTPVPAEQRVPGLLGQPHLMAIFGALLGMLVGGLIGWIVDSTLNRLGAGPPREATLVTVRTDAENLNELYGVLFQAGARRVNVAEQPAA
jgi:hypothetical protein